MTRAREHILDAMLIVAGLLAVHLATGCCRACPPPKDPVRFETSEVGCLDSLVDDVPEDATWAVVAPGTEGCPGEYVCLPPPSSVAIGTHIAELREFRDDALTLCATPAEPAPNEGEPE